MKERLVAPNACVVVDVTRFGHSNDRMNQQVGLDLFGGAKRQLLVRAMHRIAGLKRHNLRPPEFGKFMAELSRAVPQQLVVVVRHGAQARNRATDVVRTGTLDELGHARVLRIGGTKHRRGLGLPIRLPYVLHVECGDHHAFRVAQS